MKIKFVFYVVAVVFVVIVSEISGLVDGGNFEARKV